MKKSAFLVVFIILLVLGANVSANQHIPMLLYHDVQQEYSADKAVVTITPQMFEEHISTLLNSGYTSVSFEDIYNASRGKFTIPENPIVISFDDGYLTNFKYAFPIIQKYGVKATIFVVASTVGYAEGENPHFTWEQAKIMQQSGLVSIQSHTYSHADLTTLDKFSLIRELRLSRYVIEKNLGTSCDVLAFPYGEYNQNIADLARSAGYKVLAQVGETGINSVLDVNTKPFVRITAYGSWTGEDLLMMINEYAKQ